jgi:glutaconate CoA-transferase, subunit B
MVSAPYSSTELMICLAAHEMRDGTTALIGTGIPMLAAALAMRTVAPNLIPVFEFGGMGACLDKLPRAVGGSRTFERGLAASGLCDIMETAARGFIDYGFIGGAQIDPYGNINSSVIGNYTRPKVRLPGSGGGNDVGSLCWFTIALVPHDKRHFVPRVDFITTPGYIDGPAARVRAGLPAHTGPFRVISTLGTMGFDKATARMQLLALHPGVTIEQVIENTGFELLIADELAQNPAPTENELRLLREEIDREHLYI